MRRKENKVSGGNVRPGKYLHKGLLVGLLLRRRTSQSAATISRMLPAQVLLRSHHPSRRAVRKYNVQREGDTKGGTGAEGIVGL